MLNREGVTFFGERVESRAATEAVFEPMDRMQVERAMTVGCEAAGIVPRVTFHDLRRSARSA
jgi:integrase